MELRVVITTVSIDSGLPSLGPCSNWNEDPNQDYNLVLVTLVGFPCGSKPRPDIKPQVICQVGTGR